MMYKRIDELEPGDRLAQTLRHPKTGVTLITPHFVLDSKSLPRIQQNLRGAGLLSVLIYNPALAILQQCYEAERLEARAQLFKTLAQQAESADHLVVTTRSIAESSRAIGALCQALRNSQFATAFTEEGAVGSDLMSQWKAMSGERCYLALTLALEVKNLALEDINASVRDVASAPVTDLGYDDLGLGAMYIDVQDHFGDEQTVTLLNELERRPIARAIIRQRSQRFDGRGSASHLPGQFTEVILRGRAIHPYTRIAQIAGEYARLHVAGTGEPGKGGKALIPARCLWLMANDPQLSAMFDPDYLQSFLGVMLPYPLGHRVTLNTGEMGVVVSSRREAPWRPTVRVLERDGGKLAEAYDVDLAETPDSAIARYEDAPDDCLQYAS
mgnify:CR=1 FL=1